MYPNFYSLLYTALMYRWIVFVILAVHTARRTEEPSARFLQVFALQRRGKSVRQGLSPGPRITVQNIGMRNTARPEGIIQMLYDGLLPYDI